MSDSKQKYYQALNHFLKYLSIERGYSERTIKEYERDLDMFCRYLKKNIKIFKDRPPESIAISEITTHHITSFLADDILKKDNSPVTRNRKLYSLRSFYKFLKKRNYIDRDLTSSIEASKTDTKAEPIYLKIEQAQNLISTVESSSRRTSVRDLAILKVFLYCGLRLSELVDLNLDNIDYDDFSIKFYGKGSKERYVPLHSDVVRSIKNYMPSRNSIKPKNPDARKALFLSGHGRRISARMVQIMVKKYAREGGLKNADDITPHKLRHTFASIFYRNTKDIKILQDLLGHSNISTTQIYTHIDKEQRRKAIKEMPDF